MLWMKNPESGLKCKKVAHKPDSHRLMLPDNFTQTVSMSNFRAGPMKPKNFTCSISFSFLLQARHAKNPEFSMERVPVFITV